MVGKRRNEPTQKDAPSLPAEAQPSGSGAVPGTAEQSFGEQLKAGAAGQQVSPVVDDETEPELAHTEDDTALAEESEEAMVVYRGEFGRREITKEQWEQAGISGMPTVVWERASGFKVPVSVFTEQALQVLRQDQGFRVP
jgi:hypothetical protein